MKDKIQQCQKALWSAGIMCCLLAIGPDLLHASQEFGFDQVTNMARQLAGKPFKEQKGIVPDFLKNITYDQWRDIRFKDSKTLWQNDPVHFKVRFFHPGFYYHQTVIVHYIDSTGTHVFHFSPDLFDYGKNDFQDKIPARLGFAGFRIHYPINTPHYDDEIAVFLGASYFRAVARNLVYGLSARGLAINTALNGGEEFPFFKEFWILKPHPNESKITIYALLDSQSIAGAYEFIIHPGTETIMRVRSFLFTRQRIEKIGIAPMTSMYLYGENSIREGREDYRPQVHDSDGLSIFTKGGEWIWRPLVNPPQLLVNTFEVGTPQGFGLFQRDTNFDHYQDLESRPDLRPSLWITPHKDWGMGHVELVQIPSNDEKNDNINVFWVPAKSPEAGVALKFSYTMEWCSSINKKPPVGYVTDTRVAREDKGAMFVIDFQGKEMNAIPMEKNLTADITVTKGYKIQAQQVFKNTVTGGWRLIFHIQSQDLLKNVIPDKGSAVGLRAFLKDGTHPLTETWDYAFLP